MSWTGPALSFRPEPATHQRALRPRRGARGSGAQASQNVGRMGEVRARRSVKVCILAQASESPRVIWNGYALMLGSVALILPNVLGLRESAYACARVSPSRRKNLC